MSRMIPDPVDETQAIDSKTGRLAGRLFLLSDPPADLAAPTVAEVQGGTFVGWAVTDLEEGR